jgi:iron complex outermembrane recepter protein
MAMTSKLMLMTGNSLIVLSGPARAQDGSMSPTDAPKTEQPGASAAPAGGAVIPGDAGNEADTVNEGGLEEIVVTAQKREQNLQDVPVAAQRPWSTAMSAAFRI